MKHRNAGRCSCGKVIFSLDLPKSLAHYGPRACDCDFCVERQAAYLSDPAGYLEIRSSKPLVVAKQGSAQAHFLSCGDCHTLVAVGYPFEAGWKGTVNARLLTDAECLQATVSVSPKRLGAAEKLSRWHSLWLNLRIQQGDEQPQS